MWRGVSIGVADDSVQMISVELPMISGRGWANPLLLSKNRFQVPAWVHDFFGVESVGEKTRSVSLCGERLKVRRVRVR